MATPETITTSDFKLNAPEQGPGFRMYRPEVIQKAVNDLADVYGDTINNILNVLNITGDTTIIGVGGGVRPMAIGNTTAGRSNTSLNTITKGNCILRLHSSGQLIVAWKEYTGSGNLHEIFLKKAISPFTTWTNLAGDSQDPTVLAPAYNQTANQAIMLCENTEDGNLNVFTQDQTAGEIKQYIYAYDETNGTFAISSSNTTVASTPGVYLGDVIGAENYLIMAVTQTGLSECGNILIASNSAPTAWAQVAHYNAITYSGANYSFSNHQEQKRLVNMGDGRILALMEIRDTNGNTNIAWALSTDGGANWPVGDAGSGTAYELNYPGDASGLIIPQTAGGVWDTSNVIGASSGGAGVVQCWEACHIAGTDRVGLVFLGKEDATTAGQKAGVLYTEFDADTLTWTDQADHVILTPHTVSATGLGASSKLGFNNGGGEYRVCGGKAACGSDGTMRAFWMHGHSAGSGGQDIITGIHYRRLATGGDGANSADWTAEREAIPFSNIAAANASADRYRKGEFLGCKEGMVVVNGNLYFPVLWTEMQGLTTKYMAFASLYFALLPVALLDMP